MTSKLSALVLLALAVFSSLPEASADWGRRGGRGGRDRDHYRRDRDHGRPNYVTIDCASGNMRRNVCSVPGGGEALDIQLVQQHSASGCVFNQSFGVLSGNEIWVDRGCRGTFAVLMRQ